MYSAIKVNGKKLYEYARLGKTIEIKPRKIEIYNISLNEVNKKSNEIVFIVECSKGTYIRSLCEDIAKKLNTIGTMKDLERLQVGIFNIKDAITINDIRENKDNEEFINKHFITFEKILKNKPAVNLNNKEIELFLNGVKLRKDLPNEIYKIYNEKQIFIGTGEVKKGLLKRDIIM